MYFKLFEYAGLSNYFVFTAKQQFVLFVLSYSHLEELSSYL